jgi:hypothetical protein
MDPWTRTGRAIADDDELYRLLNPSGTSSRTRRRRPQMAEWGWQEELLATLRDVAERVSTTIAAQNTPRGRSAPRFKAEQRPRGAADRAELMRDLDVVAEIVEAATPWADPPTRS